MKSLRTVSALIIRLGLTLILLLILAFTIGDSKSEYIIPRGAYSICTADIDLDEDADIIVGHLYNFQTQWSGISVLKNNGQGVFFTDSVYLYDHHWSILVNNIDNNNYPDIITQGTQYGNYAFVVWYDFDTDSNYIQYLFLDYYPDKIACGDINGDSIIDLAFCNNYEQIWGVLFNEGYGNFSPVEYFNTPDYNPGNICCGDLNDDGRDDIVISSTMKTEFFFSLENGFQPISYNISTGDIEAVDFDNDGDLDIVSHHQPLSNFCRITLFENLGNENFIIHPYYDFQPKCNYMTISDFNNDSLPDILLHTQDAQNLIIFYNISNFELSDLKLIPLVNLGETIRKSDCSDFDGNGYNDIATIRAGSIFPNVNIFYNDGNGNFLENPIITESKETKTNSQLFSCYPNPFHSEINIEYQINESSFAEISIHNLKGELVKIITYQQEKGGNHLIKWDGLDDGGNPCKPGTYLLTFKVNGIGCKPMKIIKF